MDHVPAIKPDVSYYDLVTANHYQVLIWILSLRYGTNLIDIDMADDSFVSSGQCIEHYILQLMNWKRRMAHQMTNVND